MEKSIFSFDTLVVDFWKQYKVQQLIKSIVSNTQDLSKKVQFIVFTSTMSTNKKTDDKKEEEEVSIWTKAFVLKSDDGRPYTKEVFEELLDVLFWVRVICIAPIFGVICGAVPIEGMYGLGSYVAVSSLIIYLICNTVVMVDIASFGGDFSLLGEGFMQSGAIFMLSWILTFTLMHSEVEGFDFED